MTEQNKITYKIEIDTTEVQKKLDEISKAIESSKAFKALSGEVFINDALVEEGQATLSAIPQHGSGSVTINQTFNAPMKVSVNESVDRIIDNAISNQAAVDYKSEEFRHAVRDVIRDELRANRLLSGI